MDSRVNRRQNLHPHRPILKIMLLIVTTALVALGAYGLRLYSQTKYALNSTYQGIGTEDGSAGTVAKTIQQKKPFAVLLLGTDTGAFGRNDTGRSDTMIVVVINPKTQTTNMVSLPRDTAAKMIGTKSFNMQKINAAYEIGGSKMAVNTASALVNVPIKYYLTVNMGALEKVVDAVGGVDVNVAFSWSDPHVGTYKFTKGKMHLNGAEALAYARMRHADSEGDYGRQKRQQQVIKAIVKKSPVDRHAEELRPAFEDRLEQHANEPVIRRHAGLGAKLSRRRQDHQVDHAQGPRRHGLSWPGVLPDSIHQGAAAHLRSSAHRTGTFDHTNQQPKCPGKPGQFRI
nr:LCP family protein [Lacticaseibacillus camelliae]